jgi:hypothetical protein
MNFKSELKIPAVIAIVLIMTSLTLLSNLSNTSAEAQTASQPSAGPLPSGANPTITITTDPYLSVSPNPIGIGQNVLVNAWMHPPINVNRQFIKAFQIVVTKPDGTKETIGPIDSYAGDSTAWLEWPVDQLGTYKFKFEFLGMWFPAARYYLGQIVSNTSGQVIDSAYYKPSSAICAADRLLARPASPEIREWWPNLATGQTLA